VHVCVHVYVLHTCDMKLNKSVNTNGICHFPALPNLAPGIVVLDPFICDHFIFDMTHSYLT